MSYHEGANTALQYYRMFLLESAYDVAGGGGGGRGCRCALAVGGAFSAVGAYAPSKASVYQGEIKARRLVLPPGWFICLAQRHGICHCPCASAIFMTCTLVVLTVL